jgi:AraC-like DNA-binding protein
MAMQSSIPSQYLLILVSLAADRDHSIKALCEGTTLTLDSLQHLGARVDEVDADRVIANTLKLIPEPALGLILGQHLNLGAHAIIGQAFLACSDLLEVLQLLNQYAPLLIGSRTHLSVYEDIARDRIGVTLELEGAAETMPFTYQAIFSGIQKTTSDLLDSKSLDWEIDLPFSKPRDIAPYLEIFGDKVRFSSDKARLSCPSHFTRTPLSTSNRTLRTVYENECARLLAHLADDATCTEQTLTILNKLEGQYPQLAQIAAMFNVSTRTYRRRLQEEGTTFQALLDQTRLELAQHQLVRSDISIATIAHALGFSDTSNFRRAFIQWSGISPSKWRKSHLEKARLKNG